MSNTRHHTTSTALFTTIFSPHTARCQHPTHFSLLVAGSFALCCLSPHYHRPSFHLFYLFSFLYFYIILSLLSPFICLSISLTPPPPPPPSDSRQAHGAATPSAISQQSITTTQTFPNAFFPFDISRTHTRGSKSDTHARPNMYETAFRRTLTRSLFGTPNFCVSRL